MRTMPVVAPNGRYQFGPTNRIHPGAGGHDRRTYIPDLRGGSTNERTRSISFVVRETMVVDGI